MKVELMAWANKTTAVIEIKPDSIKIIDMIKCFFYGHQSELQDIEISYWTHWGIKGGAQRKEEVKIAICTRCGKIMTPRNFIHVKKNKFMGNISVEKTYTKPTKNLQNT